MIGQFPSKDDTAIDLKGLATEPKQDAQLSQELKVINTTDSNAKKETYGISTVRQDEISEDTSGTGKSQPLKSNAKGALFVEDVAFSHQKGDIANPEFSGVFTKTYTNATLKEIAFALEAGEITIKLGSDAPVVYKSIHSLPYFDNLPFIRQSILITSTNSTTLLRLTLKKVI